jgi:hypothetical protein
MSADRHLSDVSEPPADCYLPVVTHHKSNAIGKLAEAPIPTFEVLVNGVQVCTAQIEEDGSLNAILSWRGGSSRGADDPLGLHVGGFLGQTEELLRWAVPAVQIGDVITLRTSDSGEPDAPTVRKSFEPARIRADQEAYVRRMAAEWGWTIQEPPPG